MGRHLATLSGELDGHTIQREFSALADATAWLQDDGLVEFDDQPACGEVRSSDGDLIWAKSHLQTNEKTEWDARLPVRRVLARLGLLNRRVTDGSPIMTRESPGRIGGRWPVRSPRPAAETALGCDLIAGGRRNRVLGPSPGDYGPALPNDRFSAQPGRERPGGSSASSRFYPAISICLGGAYSLNPTRR